MNEYETKIFDMKRVQMLQKNAKIIKIMPDV